jgi:hypothetical protein
LPLLVATNRTIASVPLHVWPVVQVDWKTTP